MPSHGYAVSHPVSGRHPDPSPAGRSVPSGQDDMREWTSTSGRTLRAALVKDQGETIQLRLPDGKVGTIKVATLSAGDQAYLKSLQRVSTDILILYHTELHVAESLLELASESGLPARLKRVDTLGEEPRLGPGRVAGADP
jgi:hypothetical protein